MGCILLALSCCVAAGMASDTALSLFTEANARYQQGDFRSAEELYRKLLQTGIESASVYYNLGNACFKQKKLGEAIYCWERARRKSPGDADIRDNLDFANLLIVDRIDTPVDPAPVRWLDRAVHFLTINQESVLVLFLFVAANGLFVVYLLSANPRLAFRGLVGSICLGILAALFACSLGWKIYEKGQRRQGVIVEQKVDVRSGPGSENIVVVTVHEGIKVRVRGEAAGWYQVILPNGWSGWLPRSCVRVL